MTGYYSLIMNYNDWLFISYHRRACRDQNKSHKSTQITPKMPTINDTKPMFNPKKTNTKFPEVLNEVSHYRQRDVAPLSAEG